MSRTCIDVATTFAVTVAEVQSHLRISTVDSDPGYLTGLIAAAQGAVENFTDLALTTQKWRLSLWGFHEVDRHHQQFWDPSATYPNSVLFVRGSQPIKLLPCPVASIDTFTYVDDGGVSRTLSNTLYLLDADAEPAFVVPAYDQVWPSVREQPGAVKIETTNGWDDPADIPPQIKQAMLLAIGNWYENRENPGELPDAVKALLWPLRVWT